MTEREHAEKVASEWLEEGGYSSALSVADEIAPVADLIERERADAIARAEKAERERDEARAACAVACRLYADESDLRAKLVEAEVREAHAWEQILDLRVRLEQGEAAAAQMRAALQGVWENLQDDGRDIQAKYVDLIKAVSFIPEALTTDVGIGYTSPEQHARAVAEAREPALNSAYAAALTAYEASTRYPSTRETVGCAMLDAILVLLVKP